MLRCSSAAQMANYMAVAPDFWLSEAEYEGLSL